MDAASAKRRRSRLQFTEFRSTSHMLAFEDPEPVIGLMSKFILEPVP